MEYINHREEMLKRIKENREKIEKAVTKAEEALKQLKKGA